jgi:AcrR family transcriptional regulator
MNETTRSTPAPERKPGRPRADGTDQRERLLDTSVLSFSHRGIASTSLRALARDAGVTPAMLNYYFGSKERLVEAVVAERLLPVLDYLKRRLAPHFDRDCIGLITAFVRGMHEIIAEHAWLPGLWVREVLSEGGQLRTVLLDHVAAEMPRPLVKRFQQGQADGEINAALDPRLLFVSLIGLTMFPFAAAPVWRRVLDADDIEGPDMEAHALALLSAGVGP